MSKIDGPALVGIVPRKNLWPIIQSQRWYHIPVQSAPCNTPDIKYIAFYFPSAFGEKLRYQVIYYAKVGKLEVKKRIQLFPDEPKHPRKDLDYYQIHLDEIKELPHPIPSKKWRRIVHIPTTIEKLHLAEEINDLYDTTRLEETMYRALKAENIHPERQFYVHLKNQVYCLDFCIFCKKANIDLECDGERYHTLPQALTRDRIRNNQLASFGWSVLRFSGREIHQNLIDCFKVIKRTISALQGLKPEGRVLDTQHLISG